MSLFAKLGLELPVIQAPLAGVQDSRLAVCPARGIVNRLMRELGPLNAAAPVFPLATAAIAPLRAAAEKLGRSDFSPLWSGQNTSGCRAVPAAEITRELARGFAGAG